MKKIFAIVFAVLLIVLCGCKNTYVNQTLVAKNQFYLQDGLPKIESYSSKINNGRFFKEKTYEFVPSNDYGAVVPFIGGCKEFEAEYDPGFSAQTEFYYGICTLDGKIIMDAGKYSSVNLNTSLDGFSYYILTYSGNEEFSYRQTIIPLDGSFVLELEENNWLGYISDGVICIDDNKIIDGKSLSNHKFYDYNGKFLFELTPQSENTYLNISAFNSGLALVVEREQIAYEQTIKNCYYIDKTGKTVLSGFIDATEFNRKGYAGASVDGLTYGIIDKYGSFVVWPEYQKISVATESDAVSFVCIDNNGMTILFDENLNQVSSLDISEHLYIVGDTIYTAIGQYYANGKNYCVRISDGEIIHNEEYDVSPDNIALSDKYLVYTDYMNRTAVLMDYDGNTVSYIDGVSYVSDIIEEQGLLICQHNYNKMEDGSTKYYHEVFLYDFINNKKVHVFENAAYATMLNEKFLDVNVQISETGFYPVLERVLFDVENQKYIAERLTNILNFNIDGKEYYLTASKQNFCLYDENFSLILLQNNDMYA